MPSSDESVTLQTDFSFKHSLAPAIHSHLKEGFLEPEVQHCCYGNECETPRAKTQKGGIAVKTELKEIFNLVSIRELNDELGLLP